MVQTRIARVFRNAGKVNVIHCGEWPNITVFERVEINGERLFRCSAYGKANLYRPNKQTRCMEFVKAVDETTTREARRVQTT